MLIPIKELLQQALGLVRSRAKTLLPLCLIGSVLSALGLLLGLATLPLLTMVLGKDSLLTYFIAAILALGLAYLAGLWAQLALAVAVTHPEAGLRLALSATKERIWGFFGIGLVALLLIGGGFCLFILPGVLFTIWFFSFPFVHVLDGLSGFDALLKSREYTRGQEFGIFLRLLVLGLVGGLLGVIPLVGLVLGPAFLAAGLGILFQNLKSLHGDMPFAASKKDKIIYGSVAGAGFVGLAFLYITFMGNPLGRIQHPEPPLVSENPLRPSPPGTAVKTQPPKPAAPAPKAPAVTAAKPVHQASGAPAASTSPVLAPKVKKAQNKDGGVVISWDPIPEAEGYHVFVSTDGKTYKQITKKPLIKTSAKLGKMKPGQTYQVKLAGVFKGKMGPQGIMVKVAAAKAKTSKPKPGVTTKSLKPKTGKT